MMLRFFGTHRRIVFILILGMAVAIAIWCYPMARMTILLRGEVVRIEMDGSACSDAGMEWARLLNGLREIKYERGYNYVHGVDMTVYFESGRRVECRAIMLEHKLIFVPKELLGGTIMAVVTTP